jgi:SAM-dependent methyltransferase
MAHPEQDFFVMDLKNKHQYYFANQKVLDIGSLDINGSVKKHFKNCDYTGIDVGYGENVDIVCEGQDYDAPDESYDVVCSLECFEHNPYWYETFMNMIRLCKKDGLVFFTCATTGRQEHGTRRTSVQDSPLTIDLGWDYYKNLTEQDFTEKVDFSSHFSKYKFVVNTKIKDLYFYGIKR